MAKAITVERTGGPEVLVLAEIPVGEPGPGEVRVRQGAIGVNFIDVYHRNGLYKVPRLPFVPGVEGAGVVEAVGTGVTAFRPGDRLAYAGAIGGYAQSRILAAAQAIRLPDEIADEQAAGMMLKGLTANFLLRRTLPLERGDKVLFHAAAGGVGTIFCQWARHLGIEVMGTAGGPEKCARALAAGATRVIDYHREDFVAGVRAWTDGLGVKAVFDGVGADTFTRSLDCLRPFGMLISFGQASGAVPPLDILTLSAKGSLYVTRPTLNTHVAQRDRYDSMARELFEVVQSGAVEIAVRGRYPLADAAQAHHDLESRRTTGSTILLP